MGLDFLFLLLLPFLSAAPTGMRHSPLILGWGRQRRCGHIPLACNFNNATIAIVIVIRNHIVHERRAANGAHGKPVVVGTSPADVVAVDVLVPLGCLDLLVPAVAASYAREPLQPRPVDRLADGYADRDHRHGDLGPVPHHQGDYPFFGRVRTREQRGEGRYAIFNRGRVGWGGVVG